MYIYINNMSNNMSNNIPDNHAYKTNPNRESFLFKKSNTSTGILNQGAEFINNKFKKIQEAINNNIPNTKIEGYEGILGENKVMTDAIVEDTAITTKKKKIHLRTINNLQIVNKNIKIKQQNI
jgi:hypothetical protein